MNFLSVKMIHNTAYKIFIAFCIVIIPYTLDMFITYSTSNCQFVKFMDPWNAYIYIYIYIYTHTHTHTHAHTLLTLNDGTDTLSQNVGKQLPHEAA
jgi:hypothetical protein